MVVSLFSLASCQKATSKTIGIAWRADLDSEFYTNIVKAVTKAGATPVLLKQVISPDVTYNPDGSLASGCVDENGILKQEYATLVRSHAEKDSNAESVMGNITSVIFTGGEDISPTLYKTPEPWHGIAAEKDYNATRDVSDYLTLSYCLTKNIKVLGFCRGMQMLGVYSGASVMQDIPTYFQAHGLTYQNEHRNVKVGDAYRDYAPHSVTVAPSSHLSSITGKATLEGCPSWHHQALLSVDNTALKVTGTTLTDTLPMIEAIERTHKTYAIGLQFHPEAALVKNLENAANKTDYMSAETALSFFKDFVKD